MEDVKITFSNDDATKCWRCGYEIPTGSLCLICGTVNKSARRKVNSDGDSDNRLTKSKADATGLDFINLAETSQCDPLNQLSFELYDIQNTKSDERKYYTQQIRSPVHSRLFEVLHHDASQTLNSEDTSAGFAMVGGRCQGAESTSRGT